jgi:outer membrane protein OmpA-like peptidoglycan-associated protein
MTDTAQQKQASFLLLIVLVIFLVISLSTLTVFLKQKEIESDLTQRTNRLLIISGLLEGTVTFDGRDALLRGSVASEAKKQEVLDIINSVEGVRSIQAHLKIKPSVTKATENVAAVRQVEVLKVLAGRFTLRYDSGRWILVGEVESETTKENLITSTTEVIGSEIVSLLSVAPNKPRPEWVDKYLHVLEKFAYVHGGAELTLNKGILTIGGDVDSEAAMRLTLLPFSEVFGSVVSIRNTLRIPKFVNGLYQAPNSHPIEQIDLSGLQFDADNSELKTTNKLDPIIALLAENSDIYIEVAGHANQKGDEESNEKDSLQKALLVKHYLLAQGVKKSHLRTNGYGSSRPIDSDANSALNQRIEITVLKE